MGRARFGIIGRSPPGAEHGTRSSEDAGDIPDGWHCYAVRGGDGGWPPCSIEKTVWVNHAGDIITPDDLDPLLERNGWMLVIRDWWFTDEPFGHAE